VRVVSLHRKRANDFAAQHHWHNLLTVGDQFTENAANADSDQLAAA
jgi:hypothetical protein